MTNAYTVEITTQAYQDLVEVVEWYSLQRPGLEKEFTLSFEACLRRLERNPLGFQIIFKGAHSIFLQRFPYKVIYKTYGNTIKVYTVLHHSRSPKLIRKRLK